MWMGNEQKPASVPLATPGGEVRGWVCGVCARVGAIHGTMGPPDAKQRAGIAESSREDADACCVCTGCGVVGTDVWPRECSACREKRETKWAAEQPVRDAKAAESERIREEALAVSLDRDAAGALAAKMSDISEDCYCAGWLSGLEHSLWWFVVDGPGEWGMGKVDEDDVRALRALSEKCGGWIVWREGVGEVFVPLAEWLPAYAAEQERVKAWNAAHEANQAAQKAAGDEE